MPVKFEVSYGSPGAFLNAYDGEIAHGGLLVRNASPGSVARGEPCVVTLRVGDEELELDAQVSVVRGPLVSVAIELVPEELGLLVERLQRLQTRAAGSSHPPVIAMVPDAPSMPSTFFASPGAPGEDTPAPPKPASPGTVAQRLAELTVPQKLALALHCDRETRIGLLRDHNKTVHLYVLKNPRVGLDEVTWAAKQVAMSPDALKFISEHPEWGTNPVICAGLVRNPRTPLPIAAKLLSRLHQSELKAIAKGGARDQLVLAARKMVHSA